MRRAGKERIARSVKCILVPVISVALICVFCVPVFVQTPFGLGEKEFSAAYEVQNQSNKNKADHHVNSAATSNDAICMFGKVLFERVERTNQAHFLLYPDRCATIRDKSRKKTIYIRFIEERENYWFVPDCNGLPSLAIPRMSLSKVRVLFNSSEETTSEAVLFVPADLKSATQRVIPYSTWRECKHDIAKALSDKRTRQKPAISHEQFLEMVYFRDVLYGEAMIPMLFGGTLLGWYRECGLIPDTTDLDMVVRISEFAPSLEKTLVEDSRLHLYWILGKPTDSLELSVMSKSVKIDLFFLFDDAENSTQSWVGGMIPSERKKLRWTYPRLDDSICTGDLNGYLFQVPCDVEAFLEADYGKGWRIPHSDASFVWFESHHNVQHLGKWPSKEWKSVYRTRFPGQ